MTDNFFIGNHALEIAANKPSKRIVRFIENRDRVTIPSLDEKTAWFYGQISQGGPELFWVEARVVRPSTGQEFRVPVFISMLHNEMKDINNVIFTSSVDGIDFNLYGNLLAQFELVAGHTFDVEVQYIIVAERDRRTGEGYHRNRPVYTWHPC